IEQGIINEATKSRMDELEEQKDEIKVALAEARLKENLGLNKERILYFLHQFTDMDYTDPECQKRLIKTFLNSVFVYDDKVVLTFNYSGDNRTITLTEIDAGVEQGVRLPRALSHQKTTDSDRNLSFSVIFALRRVILLRSDIRLAPSDIALRAVKGRI
ncbi:MAG: hypothetical protein IJ491_07810, partial [Clostridia bacterium]|nr:hypothetical protein [Clostridia bacterium]